VDIALADRIVTATAEALYVDKAPYPEALVLDWTDYCNAKCFFCYREKYEREIGGKGEFIPFEKLRKLEKVLSNIKFFGVSSAIGEPLLHPELQQILQWLYEINPKILIRTTTNGTALTADKAAWFAGHLDWLSVSLNAANAEAHMRDMFPHLVKRGIDAEKRWQLHLRHLTEFIAALPAEDRSRIRFQMVAHRHNVKDIVEFIRVVQSVGGSHAVITNIAVHTETVDWSLYWVKDLYNDAVDEACELGTRLGVRVDAARFYTSVKPVLDLDKVCREPIDTAYISRASVGAPCCHWVEAGIPTEVYDDEDGFDRYWNHDVFHRLRRKRNLESCRVCGMSRVFDETSFHLSPKLKQDLIAAGRLSEIDRKDDYPDAQLVRTCVEKRLDLPTIRRSLLRLNLPVEMAWQIEAQGLPALPTLEQACWEAFQKVDLPPDAIDIPLAGPFIGIGWGLPIHEPQNGISARWLGGAQAASVFVCVEPGIDYAMRFTIHHAHPSDLERRLQLKVCGHPIETWLSRDETERSVLNCTVTDELTRSHNGRLWVQVGFLNADETLPAGHISLMRLELSKISKLEIEQKRMYAQLSKLKHHLAEKDTLLIQMKHHVAEKDALLTQSEHHLAEKDLLLSQQTAQIIQLEQVLQTIYNSRSWKLTSPLRKVRSLLRSN
jgi:MoaA/NifB/PqqE/SkfB family radical SAM enzyme